MNNVDFYLKLFGINEIKKNISNFEINQLNFKKENFYKIIIKKIPLLMIISKIKQGEYIIEKFDPTIIITNKYINDIIISHLYSKLSIDYPVFPFFYGYQIRNQEIITIKEYFDYDFHNFLKIYQDNQKMLTIIILHIIFSIYAGFQMNYIGYLYKTTINNIFVKKITKEHIIYNINNKKYKIPTFGYCPMIIDFSSSIILKINNEKKLIKKISKEKKINYSDKFFKINSKILSESDFDESYDIFKLMFVSFNDNNILKQNWLVKQYKEHLKAYKILYINDYYANSLTIKKFLKNSNVNIILNNYLIYNI